MKALSFYTKIDWLTIYENNAAISSLNWGKSAPEHSDSELLITTAASIKDYFTNYKVFFENIALDMRGTEFQIKVWNSLRKIPYGETVSYQDIANVINSSPRAVGQACRANRIPIIIPCHRVIAKNGNIGGFAGETGKDSPKILLKETLLNIERNMCNAALQHAKKGAQ